MPKYSLKYIAKCLNAKTVGDDQLIVTGIAEPAMAKVDDLALAIDSQFIKELPDSRARVAVIALGTNWQDYALKGAIFVPQTRQAIAILTDLFKKPPQVAAGIHPTVVIDPSAHIGVNPAIGAFCLIGKGVKIGDNAQLVSHISIGAYTQIGDNAIIHSGVRIGAQVVVGSGFICQANVVVGADGFSYLTPPISMFKLMKMTDGDSWCNHKGEFKRINSLGSVFIGDNVELGACTTIDCGTIADTTIGNRTKIDNYVHVSHNVHIGQDCIICSQVGISGSVTIGDRVLLAGKVGLSGHITVANDVIVAAKSGLVTDAAPGQALRGNPAMSLTAYARYSSVLRRLVKFFSKSKNISKVTEK